MSSESEDIEDIVMKALVDAEKEFGMSGLSGGIYAQYAAAVSAHVLVGLNELMSFELPKYIDGWAKDIRSATDD